MQADRLVQRGVQRAERGGGRSKAARRARRGSPRRGRLRERPDGDRRAPGARRGGRARARGRGRRRLRRHLRRRHLRPDAHDRPPADALARRAGVRPPARPHRGAGLAPDRAAASNRTRAAQKLRLPAWHGDAPPGPIARGSPSPHLLRRARRQRRRRDRDKLGAGMPFILRRLGFYAIAAWVALTANFFLPRAMPGNAVQAIMSKFPNLQPTAYHALEAMLGVGHPGSLWHQYVTYLYDVFHFNFGIDVLQYPARVSTLLGETIPWTIALVGTATVIAFLIGTGLGIAAGWRHGGWLDRVLPGLMFFQ